MVSKGKEGGRGKDWESGVSRCKPLYIENKSNKVLLYSTGNNIQCPVTNHNGKNIKNYVCMIYTHMCMSHFAAQQKLTQHCKSSVL